MNMHNKLLRANFQPCNVRIGVTRAGEGGGTYGEVPLRGPANYPFYKLAIIFWQKMYPFRIPSTEQWYPFHTASLLTAVNLPSF